MISLFKKKKREYWVYKFSSIANSGSFDENFIPFLLYLLKELHNDENFSFSQYDLNYLGVKPYNFFEIEGILDNIDLEFFAVYEQEGQSGVVLEKSNKTNFAEIQLTVDSSKAEKLQYEVNFMNQKLFFDYGYIRKLSDDYDVITERKLKRTLFGTELEVFESDGLWFQNGLKIKEGYLKDVYEVNYLNRSHMTNNLIIKDFRECDVGVFETLEGGNVRWSLNEEERIKARSVLRENGYLIMG